MRTLLLSILAPLAIGCGAADTTDPTTPSTTEEPRPLRSPCSATELTMFHVARLACAGPPTSPELGDEDVWRGERPLSSHWVYDDGESADVVYDYSSPYVFDGATYREDGNIESVSLDHLGSPVAQVLHYTYDGGTLVRAFGLVNGVKEAETELVYEGGRRAYEGLVGVPESRLHYVYDDQGRLIARIGSGARESLGDRPPLALLTRDCPTMTVPLAVLPQSNQAARYYLRDADGRIETVIEGRSAGFGFDRTTFEYDGDRLVRAQRGCSAHPDRELGNMTVTYAY